MLKRLRKFINAILYDKDEFTYDADLKSKVEIHNFLLQHLIELEREIVPAKIKYFWNNKKIFLLRLFFKFSLIVVFIVGVLATARYFGFRYNPEPIPVYTPITLYVTEEDDTAYIRTCIDNPMITFVMIYPPDRSKDWNKFKEEMHAKFETRGFSDSASYFARGTGVDSVTGASYQNQFWGRYQLGTYARKAIGIGNMTWEEFSTNPEVQEGSFKTWIRLLYKDMKPYIQRYEGDYMDGYQITSSGIVAMAHNVGADKTIKFLESRGKNIPYDGKSPATRFLSLGGYNLSSILNEK
jgi:hypothetical protein